MNTHPITAIGQVLSSHNVEHAIICTGSRSAPIALALARTESIQTQVIYDERSAGYVALGIAQVTHKPVAIVCTSGTAVLNLYPAVAEAYYQNIPLILLTADRPAEWLHQYDGQMIDQSKVFGSHVKVYRSTHPDMEHPDSQRALVRDLSELIHCATEDPQGPVHLNMPFREPFYPDESPPTGNSDPGIRIFPTESMLSKNQWSQLIELLLSSSKRLVVVGNTLPDKKLFEALKNFGEFTLTPILSDPSTSVMASDCVLRHAGNYLSALSTTSDLEPEILLSIGKETISKPLKKWIQNLKPNIHIHIGKEHHMVDAFQHVTHYVPCLPSYFFEEVNNRVRLASNVAYLNAWRQHERKYVQFQNAYFDNNSTAKDEFSYSRVLSTHIPPESAMHLGNSMPIRYFSYHIPSRVSIYTNRGTNGIDGHVSTSVGAAMADPSKLLVLMIGDVSFFYDRNGLWHPSLPANLRIVLFNNHGGNIFRYVAGSDKQPELNTHFIGTQNLSAHHLCKDHGIDYESVDSLERLRQVLPDFFQQSTRPKLIELDCDGEYSKAALEKFKKACILEFQST